ncbi:MAG: hypothetical protein ACXVEF_05015 [Polyangiales bacterium]
MRESSVITSLEELSKMEEQRRREDAESRARAAKERAEREERAAIAARERAAAREAENHEVALRTAVAEAQIEAEKRAQIEQSRMAVQLRLQAESLAQHEAHARELAAIVEARTKDDRKGRTTTLVASVAVFATLVAMAVLVTRSSKPEPAPAAPAIAAPRDDSAERTIERLEKEIERLRGAASAVAPPPTLPGSASASTKPTIHPQPKTTAAGGGTKCPPGVHGIPLCP